MKQYDIIVIGGGASGCMAAVAASKDGASVLLLEQNEKIGKKLYITGKGRCNFTNSQEMDVHIQHIRRNPKFLYSAFDTFTQKDVIRFFEEAGVRSKTERGDRVFPLSDKSSDILRALERSLQKHGVIVQLHSKVSECIKSDDCYQVYTDKEKYFCTALILATGGLSYPSTGATGDGYRFAKKLGHKVTPLTPSLVGLNLLDKWAAERSGLTLKNVQLTAQWDKTHKQYFGEMLFTHYGISGPIVLQLSSDIPQGLMDFSLSLSMKPALSAEILHERVQREIQATPNSQIHSILRRMLPQSMVPILLETANIDGETPGNTLRKKDREGVVRGLLSIPLHPSGFRGFQEAVITRGGVHCNEVNPKTMMSKIHNGVFFSGELLDLDADTGGYNLQIAWSTGYVAGIEAAKYCRREKAEDD